MDKLCRETDIKSIFIVILVILIVCFIIDIKIAIAVGLVFLIVFSILLSKNTRECYEPIEKMNRTDDEGVTIYNKIVDSKACQEPPYIPQPGYNADNKKYALRNPSVVLGSDIHSQVQYAPGSLFKQSNSVPNLKYTVGANRCSEKLADCVARYSNPFNAPEYEISKNNVSSNHLMSGPQNPKTRVAPMVTRPIHSLDWRAHSLIVPNMLNNSTNENLYLSGYLSPEDIPNSKVQDFVENGDPIEKEDVIEHYNVDAPEAVQYGKKSWSDTVDTSLGYSKTQFTNSGFPNNLPQGNCGRDPVLKEYNKNLFTQTVQPGVYYKDDIIEPINSNIGISFQQQFLPRTFQEVDNGLLIEDHDPSLAPELPSILMPHHSDAANIYDPRFTGYGTSYRNYVDPMTGQPRFPYDDVNAKRMPSYIVRSKIDTHNFADTYDSVQNTGLALNDIRSKAHGAFIDDTTSHRDDIMSKLMRKTNAEAWQRRAAPITKSSRSIGGNSFGSSC